MLKITHLISAHPRFDVRIFHKECSSLAKIENYDVSLIVSDNLGDEEKNSVKIYDVGKMKGRINRIFRTTKIVLQKAIELDTKELHKFEHDIKSMI